MSEMWREVNVERVAGELRALIALAQDASGSQQRVARSQLESLARTWLQGAPLRALQRGRAKLEDEHAAAQAVQ